MRMLVFGSKDFARTVAELIRHCGHEVAGMVDDYRSGPGILGNLESVARSHPPSEHGIAMAIGYADLPARWAAWERIRSAGYRAPPLIHPRAYVADNARIGEGAMVMAGSIVDVHAEIGELDVLWPGACVNHDSRIGPNCFLSPNSTVCGFVDIGPHSFIGAGAVVVDRVIVPRLSFIKAGSVRSDGTGKSTQDAQLHPARAHVSER
jgi:sugar O-acyltransferase (sialic acid O-acetyltransferase NeuD family)